MILKQTNGIGVPFCLYILHSLVLFLYHVRNGFETGKKREVGFSKEKIKHGYKIYKRVKNSIK